MEILNASNNAETQLLYDIDENDTSLQVRDADIFPKPPFLVSINHEIIKVNSVDGNTFSGLERGREGTTPAKHKAGDFVENRFTAGMYHNIADNLENQLSVLNFEGFVNNDDWSDALIAAHDALPSDGGVIVVPSPIKIKKPVVFEKRVYLKGIGFSHSPGRSPSSTILKDGDFTGLTFLGYNSFIENIDIDGVTGNGGDGINIVGSRIGMRNVSARNQGGHGIRVGGSKGDNTNGWNFTNLFTVGNGLDGLHIHHGEEGNSDPPNVNAGILVGIDTRLNGRDGIHLGNTMENTFLGVMSQYNGRYGVYVGDNARGNYFFNAYTELNKAGRNEEFYLAPGSRQNYVSGQRNHIAYNSIKDEGHANYILTTNSQISGTPYFLESGLYTSGVTVTNKENATSIIDAPLKSAGGLAIAKDIYFGGNFHQGSSLSTFIFNLKNNALAAENRGVKIHLPSGRGELKVTVTGNNSSNAFTMSLCKVFALYKGYRTFSTELYRIGHSHMKDNLICEIENDDTIIIYSKSITGNIFIQSHPVIKLECLGWNFPTELTVENYELVEEV